MATIERVSAGDPAPSAPGVVFIHGLGGDPWGTWTVAGNGWEGERFWPRWLARERPDLAIWTIGYAAPKVSWLGGNVRPLPLYDRARELLDQLSLIIGNRPLLFVGHSLGGLVVKTLLRTACAESAQYGWLPHATRGVIFLGTPHRGAIVASAFAQTLPWIASVAIKDLAANAAHLRELNRWYAQEAPARDIHTVSYQETLPYRRASLVVNLDSSDPGIPSAHLIPIDADHHTICKPLTPTAHVYLGVRRFVDDWLLNAGTVVPAPVVPLQGIQGPDAQGNRAGVDAVDSVFAHHVAAAIERVASDGSGHHDQRTVPIAPERLQVFVSSAMRSGRLHAERRAAIEAIERTGLARAWAWEREAPGGPSVPDRCVEVAASSDRLVLILDGDVTPIALREYRAARQRSRECLILVLDDTRPSPALDRFLAQEAASATVVHFGNVTELETLLIQNLYAAAVRDTRAMQPRAFQVRGHL